MRFSLILASLFLSLASLSAVAAKSDDFLLPQQGVHYFDIEDPVPVDDSNKIEVAEVFWYGCIHCFQFEPKVVEYKKNKPDYVNFVRVPAMWNGIMEMHARMFYTAEKLGVLENAQQAMFNAINIDRNPLDSPEKIAALLAQYGTTEQQVLDTINSQEITNKVQAADKRGRAYQISGTPQMVVQGKYRVETNQKVRSHQDMLNVVDYLVTRERENQSKK